MTNGEVLSRLQTGYRQPRPTTGNSECPPTMYEMMRKCWHKTPEKRPTFQALYAELVDFDSDFNDYGDLIK